MTMEELFNKRGVFKGKVIENVQSELNQFGLRIYNANVKELQDMPGSQYFEFLSKKAHEGAQNQAKVDVAHARMLGEVGEAERQGETKQSIAKINAHTAVLETERKIEKSTADSKLKSREIAIEQELQLQRIEASRAAEQRDAELQKTVEQKKAQMELERLRATTVTRAKIDRESAQEKTDAQVYAQTKQADGLKYAESAEAEARYFRTSKDAEANFLVKQKEAEAFYITKEKEAHAMFMAREREAEAMFITKQREAEAGLIARQKEAAGLMELSKAYGALADVLGGPQGLMQYFMLQNNVYEKMADANARAIHGLQPKINVWNTGANTDGADATAPIRNLFQTLPPLLSTIQDQTGINPPSWLAQMPGSNSGHLNGDGETNGKEVAKMKNVNGANGVNGHK